MRYGQAWESEGPRSQQPAALCLYSLLCDTKTLGFQKEVREVSRAYGGV
jgi:hypothetical protein